VNVTSAQQRAVDQTGALFLKTIHRFLNVYRYLRKYSREIQTQGLSGREVSTLRYLLDAEPVTIGQCRDYLYISDSSTSELVAHLEQAGHVTRARSQSDNRAVLVSLTAQGRKAARTLPLAGIPLLRERLRTLPPERLARINEAMGEILHLLEIEDED
jgi:MarR family transcriptional regulator, organic hydroperoxide resistance regulator